MQAYGIALNLARTLKFALDDPCPQLPSAFIFFGIGDGDQLPHSLGKPFHPGFRKKDTGPDQGARIPFFRLAQCQREGAQHAARPLEPIQLRPLGVKYFGQVGVKGVAAQEPFFRVGSLLARLFV